MHRYLDRLVAHTTRDDTLRKVFLGVLHMINAPNGAVPAGHPCEGAASPATRDDSAVMNGAAAADDAGEEHGFADSGGVRIHYVARGRRGPLLVMIHGFPDFWFTWRYQMPDFGGRSPRDRHGPARLQSQRPTAGCRELRHGGAHRRRRGGHPATCGEERAIIVGHDWGGAIGWALATLRPDLVRRLVVLNLPHPLCLLRELAANPRQQEASRLCAGVPAGGRRADR